MIKYEYKRIEESIKKKLVDQHLTDLCEGGWRIISHTELPAHTNDSIRVILTLEREISEIEPKKKKRTLFS